MKNQILDVLERNKSTVESVYTDFSIVFDNGDYGTLITKLDELGFNFILLKLLNSFLTGHQQKVKIGPFISSDIEVTSVVPQGGQCSPPLIHFIYKFIYFPELR